MQATIYKAETRGKADFGWLKPNYSFSFAGYYDPLRVHFGMLRVLNDDWIAPGGGFDTHPHDNMEIVTIPLTGALEHKDSMGHTSVIHPGEVQVMSAGTGITHSEYNHSDSDPLSLLQIWIFPNEKEVTPRYDQKGYDSKTVTNQFQTLITPEKGPGKLWLHQNAWLSIGRFSSGSEATYTLNNPANGVYLFVIEGRAELGKERLEKRDAAGIRDAGEWKARVLSEAQLLVIEVPMK